MEAGYGAEQQATRRARKLERLRREQDAGASTRAGVDDAIARQQQQLRAWSQGAEGERLVARAIGSVAPYGWTALHDVRWPGRKLANIDHIALGPGGLVVIDAKNWTGDVTLHDGVLRQNGYRRDREVEGVAQATAAVTALLAPQHRSATVAVICLAGQDDQEPVSCSGVTVVGRLQLAAFLTSLPPRLSPYDVADIGRHLIRELSVEIRPEAAVHPWKPGGRATLRRPAAPRATSPRQKRSRQTRSPGGRRRGSSALGMLLRLTLSVGGFWLLLQWLQGVTQSAGG